MLYKAEYESQCSTYEDAVKTLNKLQSNATTIARIKRESAAERKKAQENSLPTMESYCKRIGLAVEDLDKLNIIHISGTKGKGSVAAFCESILRHSGLTTGFFSSPHLVEVRERIRLNGRPLEKQKFAKYFFECYQKLVETSSGDDMPAYFRFLTLMSFYVYLHEKVDTVVLEVGIGGTFDATNIVRNPIVSGIAMLELDHVDVLGKTIEEIAWNKAGIIKNNRPAVALPQIYEAAEGVLFEQAKYRKASSFQLVPQLQQYDSKLLDLGLLGEHQEMNASLALQLCRLWLKEKTDDNYVCKKLREDVKLLSTNEQIDTTSKYIHSFTLPETFKKGLREVRWPGRCDFIEVGNRSLFLDGAHTPGSIKVFVDWLETRLKDDIIKNNSENVTFRILVFNINRVERDHITILKDLSKLEFDYAIFCPNVIERNSNGKNSDQRNLNFTRDSNLEICRRNQSTWLELNDRTEELEDFNRQINKDNVCLPMTSCSAVFPFVRDTIEWILGRNNDAVDNLVPNLPAKMKQASRIQVVVTGTFHLVGAVLKYLGPDVYDK